MPGVNGPKFTPEVKTRAKELATTWNPSNEKTGNIFDTNTNGKFEAKEKQDALGFLLTAAQNKGKDINTANPDAYLRDGVDLYNKYLNEE